MNAIKQEYLPHYTYNDYLLWEGKWELIFGVPYAMSPAPVIRHQIISQNIVFQFKNLLQQCQKCKVLSAVDWKMDEETVVCPDNLIVCGKEIGEKFLIKTPALIFKILSPSTAFKDRNLKFELYQAAGVKYYGLVDPDKEKVEVYEWINQQYQKVLETKTGIFQFKIESCQIDFNFESLWH
ncbi:MAG: hypothetical protein A2Y41_06070 [Spirochaetes bacterium GWB1_36_13]|nr:MAG: hypothetical protein A2Y41_06070 [Spirochaetes bacterium GWB1_36_13]